MGHKNKVSLTGQVQAALDQRLAIGQSRQQGKRDGTAAGKIYSWNTYRTYMKHCCYFVDWCKKTHGCKTLEQCRPYAAEWMATRAGLSTYTQKLEASALAKLYGLTVPNLKEFRKTGHGLGLETPRRSRDEITRSRGKKARDSHFSEPNHWEFVEFCKATGLRRRELEQLTGDALCQDEDGRWMIHVTRGTKGGRHRYAPIVGVEPVVTRIVARMQAAGDGRVWEVVPNGADVHSYRAEYATEFYLQHARPIEEIPRHRSPKGYMVRDVYACKGDRKGTLLDKRAMKLASEALGHARIEVVGEHYLRLDDD